MEKQMYELIVDDELERVAPPLAENELEILKADLLEHGCKFPLIVWGETIVDGHNRYRICRENHIPFGIERMEFADKTEAKLWIVKNQLGRRNLKEFQRCEMVLPLEDEIKEEAERRRRAAISAARAGDQTGPTLAPSQKSREILAEMAGVGHSTLDKVKVIILEADAETLQKLRSGEMKIHTAYTQLRKKEKPKKPEAGQKEEVAQKPEEDKPPVVAAYMEGPIPFEPVQRDAEPEEIITAFDEYIEAWIDDYQVILDMLAPGNATEELVRHLHERLEGFYKDVDDAIGIRLREMEE